MSNKQQQPIRAVDLFCGAGGLSWGLVEALKQVALDAPEPTEKFLSETIDLVGVNHWEQAIETHEANHPWARHFHDDVQQINPREVFDKRDPDVKILSGGIECTHWSKARGGKPVSDQKRMPAWDFLTWVQKLQPETVLVENVPEFADWGEIDDDGQPTRTGECFETWIDALHSHGYSVSWQILNAADYGDATSRERLFIMARRSGTPSFPDPTHSDSDPDLPDRRPAEEIIDWSDAGGSIWTRDLCDGRKRPLKYSTMRRIAEGIRRHCDDRLEPFADALDWIGRVDDSDDVDADKFLSVEDLRQRVVPQQYAPVAAAVCDRPFLVATGRASTVATATPSLTKYYGTSHARPISAPVDTITSGGLKYGLCVPQVLGQHSNSVARDVTDRPAPTVASGGKLQLVNPSAYLLRQQSGGVPPAADAPVPTISSKGAVGKVETRPLVMPRNGPRGSLHSNGLYQPEDHPLHTVTARNTDGYLVTPYLCPMYNGRGDQRPRTRETWRPLMTVPGSKSPAGIATPSVQPFIDDYESTSADPAAPLGTITSRDRFALVVPEMYPWGLDVRYRMLQPRELQRAQGFPDDYQILGNKRDTTKQIGNAVPVNLAQSLVESLLSDSMPALTDYVDDDPATVEQPDGATGGAVSDD